MAIYWTSKDPDEIDTRRHDFSALMDEGETVVSYSATRLSGTVAVDAPTFPTAPVVNYQDYRLSGGVDGEASVFDITITTDAARTLNDTIILPVASTVPGVASGGYNDPTAADIIADFPSFATVPVSTIQRRIARTSMYVDTTWLESDFTWAKELLVAYWLTQMGQGTGTSAEIAGLGLSGVSRLKSGALDVSFKSAADAGTGTTPAPWNENGYGVQFYALLRKNKGGVYVAAGAGCGYGPQSTDLPWAYRTGGFGL